MALHIVGKGRWGVRELKYEMHLALAQYNGPAFFSFLLYFPVVKQLLDPQVAGILIVSYTDTHTHIQHRLTHIEREAIID